MIRRHEQQFLINPKTINVSCKGTTVKVVPFFNLRCSNQSGSFLFIHPILIQQKEMSLLMKKEIKNPVSVVANRTVPNDGP